MNEERAVAFVYPDFSQVFLHRQTDEVQARYVSAKADRKPAELLSSEDCDW